MIQQSRVHCVVCENVIPADYREEAMYCSEECAQNQSGDNARIADGVGRRTRGVISEMLVQIDLMRRNWHIFVAESPDAPCRMIASHGNKMLRVAVASGTYYVPTARLYFPSSTLNPEKADVTAVVTQYNQIHYVPDVFNANTLDVRLPEKVASRIEAMT